jgi:hypothetical protein
MYPAAELRDLEQRRALLRAKIALCRLECTRLAAEVSRPLDWIDRAVEQWHKISPAAKLAAIPLGLLLKRGLLPGKKLRFATRAIRLLPVVLTAVKMFRKKSQAQAGVSP